MSAKHALLGLLLDRPAYPYELADRLQRRLGPAWAVNSGQLYQTVSRLEQEGLIERVAGSSGPRDDRHVFAITEAGVAEFERWFERAASGARLSRRPLLVKITLAGAERQREVLHQIDAYELDCAERLNELSSMREAISLEKARLRADHVLLRLNLSADIFQLEGELHWARQARETVSWLLEQDVVWPTTRARATAVADTERERRVIRKELFDRMSAGHLRSVPGADNRDRAGEP
jgi:DNA-binding PadR family transcriptional regulator